MKIYIKEYIEKNLKSIIIFSSCLLIGLVIGIIAYQFVGEGVRNELIKSIKITLDITKEQGFEGINVIKNGISSNLLIVFLIYFSAITLVAPILMCGINLFKGFTIGLYIPTLFQIFGFGNGLLSLLLLVIIPNVVYIPSFIYLCINAITMHYDVLEKNQNVSKTSIAIKNMYKLVIGFSVMFLSVIIEQFTCL